MPKRLIKIPQTQPARAIVAIVSAFTFFAGLWLLTPWYESITSGPVVSAAFSWPVVVGALVNSALALPGIYGVWKNTPQALSTGAYVLFCWYLFTTLSRIILYGAESLYWITTLIIALILAVVKIEQAFVAKGRMGVKEVEVE